MACGERLPEARRSQLWVVLGIVVLLVGVAAIRVPATLATDPLVPVEELVAALEAGDAERMVELLEFNPAEWEWFDGVGEMVDGGLLSSETLAEGWELPEIALGEAHEISSWHPEPERERNAPRPYAVQLRFGDRAVAGSGEGAGKGEDDGWVGAARTTREDTGWIREWELLPDSYIAVFGRLVLPQEPSGLLTIGGTVLEPETAGIFTGRTNRATAVVGTYEVSYEHPLFDPAFETVTVRSDQNTQLTLPVGNIRSDVEKAVVEQIHDHIETCAEESVELRPVWCVLHHDPGHFIPLRGDVEWMVESMPEVSLAPADSVYEEGRPSITVTTETPGRASVTYALLEEEARTVTVDVEVGGSVSLGEEGDPEWRP
ncbi:hypothetical protein NE857_06785 [Nocardiopsis exhalans]|uniref:Uncharacterized protein n=1 Tax=Nocardiopsis exhalans TaxID=163604 RepID=A0ABY5DAE5_9ACTN|nr:hypothetical protein [Nocardiopsis exhalans]USY21319.1 hypothetical protein NE857_06785 [Nocardiopsis exhalans]